MCLKRKYNLKASRKDKRIRETSELVITLVNEQER